MRTLLLLLLVGCVRDNPNFFRDSSTGSSGASTGSSGGTKFGTSSGSTSGSGNSGSTNGGSTSANDMSTLARDMASFSVDMAPQLNGGCGAPCGLFPQCGCGPSENCVPTSPAANECVSAGSTGPGVSCSSNSDCTTGSMCAYGNCHPFCNSDADCPGFARACIVNLDANSNPFGGSVCTRNCNPLDATDATHGFSACGAGVNCAAFGTQARPFSDCYGWADPGLGQGADCSSSLACDNGFTCLQKDAFTFTCLKNCRIGMSGDCPAGKSCSTQFVDWAASNEYGLCN